MPRSVFAFLLALFSATVLQAQRYPIATVPKWPEHLPPTTQDLDHYGRGRGHTVPSTTRLAQATVTTCGDGTSTPVSIPPSTPYAVSWCGPDRGDYECTAIGPATFNGVSLNGTCQAIGVPPVDAAGKPITYPLPGIYRILVGGVQQPWAGILQKTGPDTAGNYTFQTPGTLLSPQTVGRYDVAVTVSGGDQGPESDPAVTPLDVVQATGCTYALSAPGQSFQAAGGSGDVTVTTQAGCAWTSFSGASWVTVTTGTNSSGPGSMTFTAAANMATVGRTGTLTIAGQTFTVSQAGVPTVDQCAIPLGAETPSVFVTRWTISGSQVSVAYQLASKSPILEIQAKVDGQLVRRQGGTDVDLTWDGGLWIPLPAKGTHKVSVWVRNQAGCQREALSPVDLRVK